jgi:hypothetical protein
MKTMSGRCISKRLQAAIVERQTPAGHFPRPQSQPQASRHKGISGTRGAPEIPD